MTQEFDGSVSNCVMRGVVRLRLARGCNVVKRCSLVFRIIAHFPTEGKAEALEATDKPSFRLSNV